MSLTDGTGLSATDIMALTNGNNDGIGGNGGFGWWVILFILLMGGGFWGGNNFAGGGGGNTGYLAADVQRGFDQSAIITALSGLSTAVSNGFAAQSVDACNKAMNTMQAINGIGGQINNAQNAILMQMGNYEMARQQCCCDNKMAVADLKASLLAEHCADRADIASAMNDIETKMANGFQDLKDQYFQGQMDALRRENENLRMQAYMNNLAASQNSQTADLKANNQYQTDQIMSFLNPPYSRPFYGWNTGNNGCCGIA